MPATTEAALIGLGNTVKSLREANGCKKTAREHADSGCKQLQRGEVKLALMLAVRRSGLKLGTSLAKSAWDVPLYPDNPGKLKIP